jgi:uncharacterized protein YceK
MKKFYLLLAVAIMTSGCATLLTGTKDTISFSSNPQGAVVYKDGVELCRTPCSIPVKRTLNTEDIEFKLDGYDTRLLTLDKKFNVVSVINLGSLFGWAVDAASGSLVKYGRKSYDLEMRMCSSSVYENPKEIHINTKNKTAEVYVVQK